MIRRVYVTANHVLKEDGVKQEAFFEQLELFTDYEMVQKQQAAEKEALARERKVQQAMLDIKKKFGKNAVLKGMNLEAGAMTMERNRQIGGHKA